jgi:PIN domain nuclease of toxin-antitoxin system
MKLLLDTHVLLWFLREPSKLPSRASELIQAAGKEANVSIASLWEIAIKSSINKLHLPLAFEDLFPRSVLESGLSLLPIEPEHLQALSKHSITVTRLTV